MLVFVEVLIFLALIGATRCANYQDVFIGGEIYFTDADCYARMTRARLAQETPGLILRHHDFENYPAGTSPHTTAPLDYLIVMIAVVLRPLTVQALDLAGAIVSPLLALATGWFLWWWSRGAGLLYRGALLLLFALSPILVHGTELGRPDHQSLLLALVTMAICAEWSLASGAARRWSLVSGAAWGLALWVSLYEPLGLLGILFVVQLLSARKTFFSRTRLAGWALCGGIVFLALLIERRLPVGPAVDSPIFANWARTIGELNSLSLSDPLWLRWVGLLLVAAPAFLWIAYRSRVAPPLFLTALLAATFALTMWQARWGYFFAMIFALALPACLGVIRHRIAGWALIVISLLPILKEWDEKLWPNEFQTALNIERRTDALGWRAAAKAIDGPFLAPWWWSPAVAYWSGQPGVAGSSHEALPGIEQSARLFLAADWEQARAILAKNQVAWLLIYDAERAMANSAAILGLTPPENPLGRVLDRTPSQAPPFLQLAVQNSATKLFRVRIFREKETFSR